MKSWPGYNAAIIYVITLSLFPSKSELEFGKIFKVNPVRS
uniref:Uncharacterized protein n=1 Tax=Picea glauca TaxID=3330 RepID=A0A101LZV9_PICGL|nr:hypothetical protein ABT39_MTgene4446 [Picea glauca]